MRQRGGRGDPSGSIPLPCPSPCGRGVAQARPRRGEALVTGNNSRQRDAHHALRASAGRASPSTLRKKASNISSVHSEAL